MKSEPEVREAIDNFTITCDPVSNDLTIDIQLTAPPAHASTTVNLDEVKIRLKKDGVEVDSKTWPNPATMDLSHPFPDAKTNYGNGTYKATGEAKWTYTPATFTETDDTSNEVDVPCGPIGPDPTC